MRSRPGHPLLFVVDRVVARPPNIAMAFRRLPPHSSYVPWAPSVDQPLAIILQVRADRSRVHTSAILGVGRATPRVQVAVVLQFLVKQRVRAHLPSARNRLTSGHVLGLFR